MRDMPQQRHTPLNQNKKVSSYFLISELFTKLKSQARQIPITKANFLKITIASREDLTNICPLQSFL